MVKGYSEKKTCWAVECVTAGQDESDRLGE